MIITRSLLNRKLAGLLFFGLSIFHPVFGWSQETPCIAGGMIEMTLSQSQELSITNYKSTHQYTWKIDNGIGQLSATTGKRVTYTTPNAAPGCNNNPTIEVTATTSFGSFVGTYKITINANTSTVPEDIPAYVIKVPKKCWNTRNAAGFSVSYCTDDFEYYNCKGELACTHATNWHVSGRNKCAECIYKNPNDIWGNYTCKRSQEGVFGGYCFCPEFSKMFAGFEPDIPLDLRNGGMKAAGCCPQELLPNLNIKTVPSVIYLGKCNGCLEQILSKVSNPVSVYNGNNFESVEDIRLPSPNNSQFTFKRYYNSQANSNLPLGYGWRHTYHLNINPSHVFENDTYLFITDESGRGVFFQTSGGGQYSGAFNEKTTVRYEDPYYVWYRTDGSRYAFDNAKLIWIEDAIGNRQILAYDANGRLDMVTDEASGRSLGFHYTPENRIDYVTGPGTPAVAGGIWVDYNYDANGNLISVAYADGSGFDYEYTDANDAHNLTAKKDKAGHLLSTWTYDNQDRAIGSFTRQGTGVSINYVNDNQVEVTDAYGILRTYYIYKIDGRKRVTEIVEPLGCAGCGGDKPVRIEYDQNMNVIEIEYASGMIKQFDNFDSRGNPRTVIEALGTADERTIYYTYHPDLNVKLSRTEASVVGGGNKVTTWDYDSDGNGAPNENPTPRFFRVIDQGFTLDDTGVISYEDVTVYDYN
nr:DUF6531 domain-containing protein [Desulfobacterales bacterium]